MYRLSESEFMQYEMAESRFCELCEQHRMELRAAYDGIHPTRTCINYDRGEIYWESVNPVEYAIYLIELKDEFKRIEKWWEARSLVYREAFERLTPEEQKSLNRFRAGSYQVYLKTRKKLRDVLASIIQERPELQRRIVVLDEIEDMEEADRLIDQMSDEELLADYWDLDEQVV